MKPFVCTLAAMLLSCTPLPAWECPQGLCGLIGQIDENESNIGYTYRRDSLNWSIGLDEGPDILSELSWKDLYINQITGYGILATDEHLYLRWFADYGRIFHGTNQDSDFLNDNREDEFSRSISKADKGEVFDLTLAFGRSFTFFCDRLRIVPLIGYSWSEQHLRMMDGEQVLFTPNPALTGPIDNLHSSYKTRWYGPWLGADFSFFLKKCFTIFGTIELHSTSYRGIGHWNLREEFIDDFHHKAHGQGVTAALGLKYQYNCHWNLSFLASYETRRTHKGSHTVLIDLDEDVPVIAGATLNAVHWHSAAFTTTCGYSF
jgi:hypothetical protein